MTGRTVPWWHALHHAGARELPLDGSTTLPVGAVADPWGHLLVPAPHLTVEQRAELVGFDDQPPVPRLRDVGGPR